MVVMLLLLLLLLVVVFVSSPFCGRFLGRFCFWRLWGCCSREKKSFSMRLFFFSFLFYSLFECNI